MVTRARELGQLAVGERLDAALAQPALGANRALGREDLEHLPPAAQRLADRPPPVDELRRHFGTSWKPPATSRTTQPPASISLRTRSASSNLRSARSASRRSASSTSSAGASSSSAS